MNPWLNLQSTEIARTNPGNICHIQAIPVQDIFLFPRINPLTQTMQDEIIPKSGKQWFKIKLLINGSLLNESNSYEPGGQLYQQNISGTLYGQSVFNHLQAYNWTFHQWVIIATEVGSEISYLIGNPFRGARLTVNYNNQETTITQLNFDFISTCRAIIYQGPLI